MRPYREMLKSNNLEPYNVWEKAYQRIVLGVEKSVWCVKDSSSLIRYDNNMTKPFTNQVCYNGRLFIGMRGDVATCVPYTKRDYDFLDYVVLIRLRCRKINNYPVLEDGVVCDGETWCTLCDYVLTHDISNMILAYGGRVYKLELRDGGAAWLMKHKVLDRV